MENVIYLKGEAIPPTAEPVGFLAEKDHENETEAYNFHNYF
jgi:hypothetical protein